MASLIHFAAILTAATALLMDLFLHRFQRATLAVANLQMGGKWNRQEIARLQLAMTPDWVGAVCILEKIAAVVAVGLLYLAFSWWGVAAFALLYLLGVFAGIGGVFIPIMPYSWYLASIEKHLESSLVKLVAQQRLPAGATTDVHESVELSSLVHHLAEFSASGETSVESVAAGRIPSWL